MDAKKAAKEKGGEITREELAAAIQRAQPIGRIAWAEMREGTPAK